MLSVEGDHYKHLVALGLSRGDFLFPVKTIDEQVDGEAADTISHEKGVHCTGILCAPEEGVQYWISRCDNRRPYPYPYPWWTVQE